VAVKKLQRRKILAPAREKAGATIRPVPVPSGTIPRVSVLGRGHTRSAMEPATASIAANAEARLLGFSLSDGLRRSPAGSAELYIDASAIERL
jgi:hypothetical protein